MKNVNFRWFFNDIDDYLFNILTYINISAIHKNRFVCQPDWGL